MKLKSILQRIAPRSLHGPADVEITGVVCDSRQVRAGNLFVAIPGAMQDGRRFLDDAAARGASAVVAEGEAHAPTHVSAVVVDDARLALAALAKAFWQDAADRLQLVGVTGTNGKTTVAYLVRDLLDAAGHVPGLISTVAYRIGTRVIPATRTTPDAPTLHRMFAEMVAAGCRSAVMEVSSHALAQRRVAALNFQVAIFTNLTRDHLDYHGTMEAYYAAKAQLFSALGGDGHPATAVVNQDDVWGQRLVAEIGTRVPLLTYGLQGGAKVTAANLAMTARGATFRLVSPVGEANVQLKLQGAYNVSNALAAGAAALAMGMDVAHVAKALSAAQAAPGRLQEVGCTRGFQVFVDYAHTDDALARMLETVREVADGRLLLVFGCGGNRDTTKRAAMGAVAARLADYVVVTSDNPRKEEPQAIIAQIMEGAPSARHLEPVVDRRAAIARVLSLARLGDVVVVAGKGHETMQEFAHRSLVFDDVQVVLDLLAEMEQA
ncbi:MAG: UDP-N-acetylmuramoyl-L-alanyl-D-glutamate--2,6-diaminopimelate ligase [Verrucomicrobia bacterium]|nr:UDP-N-acetylmuramoyl-L-alanyl-D-glutamate--2,6-diaminopimelate ligase [Verrucomicrobiota bacterium]